MADSNDNEQSSAFEGGAQARTPGRDIFGKLDDHLPEIRIPFEVKQDAERAARLSGCGDLTTWLRELVYVSLYGEEHVGSLYQERARRVRGNAPPASPVQGTALPSFLRNEARGG